MGKPLYISREEQEIGLYVNESGPGEYTIKVGENEYRVNIRDLGGGFFIANVNGNAVRFYMRRSGDEAVVTSGAKRWELRFTRVPSASIQQSAGEAGGAHRVVRSPMPGRIVRLMVKEGDKVEKNSVLLTLEAMKMENEIRSPARGVVKKVYVKENDRVEGRVELVEIEVKA